MDKLNLKPVDVIYDISLEEFHEKYLLTGKPVILKNYTKNWKAIDRWNYSYLREKAGNIKVKLYGKWLENNPTAIEMPPVKEVLFGEYLDMLEQGVQSDLRIFLFNIFKHVPELLEDFEFTPVTTNYLKDFPYMFFGCSGSDVRLHYDIDLSNVFITQFCGTKRIVLFEQSQSKYLYKLPFTTHSAADLMNVDFNKYPALKYAEGYECVINHGDTLFMPGGIWHYIQYVDGSFSLSLRSLSPTIPGKIQGAYNVFVIRKLDELLNKYYKNSWSDFKLKRAIQKANEIVRETERERKQV
ncbi:MAG: cupin-like domain-containing protein [Thermaurantimonas sp.]